MTTGANSSYKRRRSIASKDQVSSIDLRSGPKVFLIGGPTAAGKSRLALEIARQIPCEIINADSRQIYKKLRIGTSQPESSDFSRVPHHLYGFLNPDDSFTAADFERRVSVLIPEIIVRGRLPVIVGGTGFYMKAALRGLWPVTATDDALRRRLREIGNRHEKQFLHSMLLRLDPVSAASIAPADTYRLIRALEIFFKTGIRRSELPRNQKERYDALKYYVELPREMLFSKIEGRTETMLAHGWVEEVRDLLAEYPDFEKMPAAKSLGYQQILSHIRGEIDMDQCKDAIIMKTRQYAKRQLTWFRNQDGFEPVTLDTPLHKIVDSVLQWYQNRR